MSNHNYSQYSNKNRNHNNNHNKPVTTTSAVPVEDVKAVKMESAEPVVLMGPIEVVQETVETVAMPETVTGVVVNCAKLNVREKPSIDAEVVCVLDVMSEFEIDVNKTTNDWYSICTAAGIEGYCMKKFVEAHL